MFDLKSLDDDRLVDWMKDFVTKLKPHASSLGVSDSQIDSIDRDQVSLSRLVTERKKLERADVDPQIKREYTSYTELIKHGPSSELQNKFPSVFTSTATKAAPGVVPRVMEFVKSLQQKPGMSPDLAEKLGIAGLSAGSLKHVADDQSRFTDWTGNLLNGVRKHKSQLGVNDSELNSLESDYEASDHLVKSTETARQQGASGGILNQLMGYKDMIVNGPSDGLKRAVPGILGMVAAPGILSRLTGTIEQLKGKPGFDDLIGKTMGISGVAGAAAGRAREAVGAGAGAMASGERPAAGAGSWKWLLPVLALVAVGLLAWRLSTTRPAYMAPKAKVPAPIGALRSATPKLPAGTVAPLAVSDLRFQPSANGGVLSWTTNRPATGQIEYGKTPSYELGRAPKTISMDAGSFVARHNTGLRGLSSGKRYYVRAVAQDEAGRRAASQPYSFTAP